MFNGISEAGSIDDGRRKAEEDAQHLAHAHAIKKEPRRYQQAIEAAKRLNLETQENARETADHAEGMEQTAMLDRMYPTMIQTGPGLGPQGA
ncbi:MAG: hypothetical protein ACP5SH_12960 [Syntrophobacteraceae bacterium]